MLIFIYYDKININLRRTFSSIQMTSTIFNILQNAIEDYFLFFLLLSYSHRYNPLTVKGEKKVFLRRRKTTVE
jgi:hypothetical protein